MADATLQYHPRIADRRHVAPPGLIPAAVIIFLVGGIGPNTGLALLSALVLIIGGSLVWRPGEAPVLLLAFGLAWLGASTAVFHANWLGINVADYTGFPSDMQTSIVLTLTGLLALAAGMRLGAGRPQLETVAQARTFALSYPMWLWFRLYVAASVAAYLALGMIWIVPGLAQIILGFVTLKWAFFYMLAYAALLRPNGGGPYFAIAFAAELLLGIGGYFSDFKTVFLVALLALVAAGIRVSLRTMILLGLFVTVLVGLNIVWTAVKGPYRDFVSMGKTTQIVSVDYSTRMNKLIELVGALDESALSNAADTMLHRLSYVEYFGAVLNYVPAVEPHANGEILLDALTRPLMPRILFPEKSAIDDTERTNQYTGNLIVKSDLTSISLGYVAESYIDFGAWGMLPMLSLIGYFYGQIYRQFLRLRRIDSLLGMAIAVATLLQVALIENSFTKVFGGVVATLLAAALLVLFIIPRWAPWLARVAAK